MNVKEIRRKNLRALSRSIGGVTKLANRIERSQSQISHLIGTHPLKNIGDKLAAVVERAFNRPIGWLDQDQFGAQEEEAIYQIDSPRRTVYYVPFLTWQEAQVWSVQSTNPPAKNRAAMLATNVKISSQAFALRVEGDSMESASGVSFFDGATIVVDPELPISSGAYVLAKPTTNGPLVFKQLIIDGNKRYLKPLNSRYPLVEINPQTMICGVVRMMQMEFK